MIIGDDKKMGIDVWGLFTRSNDATESEERKQIWVELIVYHCGTFPALSAGNTPGLKM